RDGGDGPDADEGPPDDQGPGDGAEDATVLRVGAVVAHHPVVVLGDLHGPEVVGGPVGRHIRLVQDAAVDEHVAVAALDGLVWQRDHTFAQILDIGVALTRR